MNAPTTARDAAVKVLMADFADLLERLERAQREHGELQDTQRLCHTELDADLEEERRMFYVAMTRAKKELTICWAKKQFSHELTVSRFVEEMKDDRAV